MTIRSQTLAKKLSDQPIPGAVTTINDGKTEGFPFHILDEASSGLYTVISGSYDTCLIKRFSKLQDLRHVANI